MSQKKLARAWDSQARRYDACMGRGAVTNYMRRRSLEILAGRFKPGMRVLDIGSGTGEEAIYLAARGVEVTGIDVSNAMVKRATLKARAAGVANVRFIELAAEDLQSLGSSFDGVYSSFGPANCLSDLEGFASGVASIINGGGFFISSVMNRFYPFEILYYLAKLDPRKAFRRLGRNPLNVAFEGTWPSFDCRYYSPSSYIRPFRRSFDVDDVSALPLIFPPYTEGSCERFEYLFDKALKLERRIRGRYPWSGLGDHFLVTMRRKPN